jgi:hypothetical protein
VRAVDEPTARFFAVALERESSRLERLNPWRPSPPLEVWVSAEPLDASGRVCANARRGFLSRRWTIRVDRGEGPALLGHELFHARYHDTLSGVPPAWEEGLADRFGLASNVLGDGVRAARLLAASSATPPELELTFALPDGSYSGSRRIVPSAARPTMTVARAARLTRAELGQLGADERRRFYGIGFAMVERWLEQEDPARLPPEHPHEPCREPAAELERWARAALDPELRWRWALWAVAPAVLAVLEHAPLAFASPQDGLANLHFQIRIGKSEVRTLNGDDDFLELVQLLWPLIRQPHCPASSPGR